MKQITIELENEVIIKAPSKQFLHHWLWPSEIAIRVPIDHLRQMSFEEMVDVQMAGLQVLAMAKGFTK
jgi:hypothetical protein